MNGIGNFSSGSFCPAGIGLTSSGVMITSSSELLRVVDLVWKSLPRIGILEMPGTFERLSRHLVVEQAGNHEALAALQFDFGLHAPRGHARGP